jgi:hypothetical protein
MMRSVSCAPPVGRSWPPRGRVMIPGLRTAASSGPAGPSQRRQACVAPLCQAAATRLAGWRLRVSSSTSRYPALGTARRRDRPAPPRARGQEVGRRCGVGGVVNTPVAHLQCGNRLVVPLAAGSQPVRISREACGDEMRVQRQREGPIRAQSRAIETWYRIPDSW